MQRGGGAIWLEEDDRGSTCKPITLHKRGKAVVLRPDKSAGGVCPRPDCAFTLNAPNRLFPLFRLDVVGLTSMCDYIVFCQEARRDDARLFVLLCELKSENIGGSRNQLEKGRLLADYILAMATHQHAVRPMPSIQRRGLVFSPRFEKPKGNLVTRRCVYAPLPGGSTDMPFARYRDGEKYPLEHFCA